MHGMPKKYDAATKERAVRMVQEQLPEYGGSLTKVRAAHWEQVAVAQGHGAWVVPP